MISPPAGSVSWSQPAFLSSVLGPPSRWFRYRPRGCPSHFIRSLARCFAPAPCFVLQIPAPELAVKLDQFLRFSRADDFVRKIEVSAASDIERSRTSHAWRSIISAVVRPVARNSFEYG